MFKDGKLIDSLKTDTSIIHLKVKARFGSGAAPLYEGRQEKQ